MKQKYSIGDLKIHFINHQKMHLYNYADFAEGHNGGLCMVPQLVPKSSGLFFTNGGAVVHEGT